MAFVQRRSFYAKIGMAGPLVEHIREFSRIAAGAGATLKERVLTDYMSGRTDRVVWEWEFEDWAEFEAIMASAGDAAEAFAAWERRMNEMVEYAEVENWSIQ